ncbi:ATP-binding cassette domain-containing protein [Kineosporia sp. J2-2]|uniref:ATP-binding cassette domain-containing protein n=1 Tax=Kineosporia corallincola TaxID=2835133 RepID=A0ABS5TNY1_9ACTN|nr:ATP-binding cassette domain-containing protein [Kineosporia corallincola]MBT0772705.1 ATP-binding cassette domain-containing protein [Kineosporia corallincola]
MTTVIETSGLGRGFGEVRALDSLHLAVPEGTVCALLGPNGAGKTTAVRILATLALPDSGSARICGFDVVTQAAQVRRRIGLAGQHAAVDDALTGRDNLFLLGLMHHLGRRAARARAAELLTRFGLDQAADRMVKTWSGGMRRRLDLIASLITRPPVLFLDEPTTGLDPRSRDEIHSTVADLARSGTTVLLTTQYLEEADRLASDVVIIDSGREIAHGTPEQLKDLAGTRVEVLVGPGAPLSGAALALTGLGGQDVTTDEENRRVSGTVTAGSLTLPGLVRHLDEIGIPLQDAGVRRPTLDEVFLTLTGSRR